MNCQAALEGCAGCSGGHAQCVCHRPRRRAVVLLNLGTPDSASVADVRRYLREFLADPFVIKLPKYARGLTPVLAALIAQFRGARSAEAYGRIWWDEGSPLGVITQRQCHKLQDRLGDMWTVYHAMRYGSPSIRDVLAEIVADEVTELVVVPMYPQWAGPTTGTAADVLYRELRRQGLRLNLTVRAQWYDDRGYIESQAHLLNRFIAERGLSPETSLLLFSAHSMPKSYIRDGDPYEGQIRKTIDLVRRRLGWPEDRALVSFQSKLGPVPWLGPSTSQVLEELAQRGEKNVVVCPISFTADCLETLEEIGMMYAEQFAEHSSGGQVHLAPALNDDDQFIGALAALVRKGPHSVNPHQPILPLSTSSEDEPISALISRLVMVGVARAGRLEDPSDPSFVDSDCLRSLRRERVDLCESIQKCRAQPHVDGCFVFNTCQRSELYALVDHGGTSDLVIPGLRASFFASAEAHVEPTALKGRAAFRRLLGTAMGLNSTLPGDADVLEQLHSARLMAQHAQTLSPGLMRLLEEVDRMASSIRQETAWGSFMIEFAAAGLSRMSLSWCPTETDTVIIGGSTTSRQLLRLMVESPAFDCDRLTFVYRGTARKDLVKFIRRVAPHARRLRVDRYDDHEVVEAIREADIVFFGIDSREPVLRRAHLDDLRDFAERPLTIVDFNSFGSTVGLDGIQGVRLIDAEQVGHAAMEYGEMQMNRPGFDGAFEEARRYVETAACAAVWDPITRRCVHGSCEECEQRVNGGPATSSAKNERSICPNCQ